jgi:hypothetical protein
MKMTRGSRFPFFKIIYTGLICILFAGMMVSCTKQSDSFTPIVQPPTVIGPPTGDIQSFILTDSLIAFNTGSTAKWLVTNTNTNSVIRFDSVIVGNYGVLDTGPLKQNTTFTLSVNNGKKADVSIKIADSITSLLWNKGKRLKQTKYQFYLVPVGQTGPVWVDTPMTAQVADQRIYFNLDGSSKIIQSTASQYVSPPDAGKFTVNSSLTAFTWRNVTYILGGIDNSYLDVTYDTIINGKTIHARNLYVFE